MSLGDFIWALGRMHDKYHQACDEAKILWECNFPIIIEAKAIGRVLDARLDHYSQGLVVLFLLLRIHQWVHERWVEAYENYEWCPKSHILETIYSNNTMQSGVSKVFRYLDGNNDSGFIANQLGWPKETVDWCISILRDLGAVSDSEDSFTAKRLPGASPRKIPTYRQISLHRLPSGLDLELKATREWLGMFLNGGRKSDMKAAEILAFLRPKESNIKGCGFKDGRRARGNGVWDDFERDGLEPTLRMMCDEYLREELRWTDYSTWPIRPAPLHRR